MALEPQGWILGLGHLVPEGPRDGPRGAEGPSRERPEPGRNEGGLLELRDQEQVLIFFMFNHRARLCSHWSPLIACGPCVMWVDSSVLSTTCPQAPEWGRKRLPGPSAL